MPHRKMKSVYGTRFEIYFTADALVEHCPKRTTCRTIRIIGMKQIDIALEKVDIAENSRLPIPN